MIPLPDSNFMTHLLSLSILIGCAENTDAILNTCVEMGAKVEGVKENTPNAPWRLMQELQEKKLIRINENSCSIYPPHVNYASPLDCAVREADINALKWLKSKQPTALTDNVWCYYLRKYAPESVYITSLFDRRNRVSAILRANPDLTLDQQTIDVVHSTLSAFDHSCETMYIYNRILKDAPSGYAPFSRGLRSASMLLDSLTGSIPDTTENSNQERRVEEV